MLKRVGGMFVLTVVLAMVLLSVSGVGVVAQAGERIVPEWLFRSHSSEDKELWGNRGVAPRGYIVGGPAAVTAGEELTTTHTVVKGECLWYIAGYKNIYGDSAKWSLIYRANKDKIKDPDLIYPGQILRIPR